LGLIGPCRPKPGPSMRAVLGARRVGIWGPAQARLRAVLARPILFRAGPCFGLLFSGRARAGPKSPAQIPSSSALPQLYSSTGGTTCLRACKIKHTARLAEAAIPNQSTKRHESRGHIKHWLARSVFSFFFLGAHSLARCLMQCFSFFFRILMAYIHTLTRAFIEKNDRKWILKKPLSSS
jgi:hypothetical protein